jgi:hypothetical protein
MEEQIQKIIENYNGLRKPYSKTMASEITTHVMEFIAWKDKHVGTPNKNGTYLYYEDHFDLDDLYNYWRLHINHK